MKINQENDDVFLKKIASSISSSALLEDWPAAKRVIRSYQNASGSSDSLLALLACQAVGGDPSDAIPLAAASEILFFATHLLDAIQDEEPDGVVSFGSSADALSHFIGLFFLAQHQLSHLPPAKQSRYEVTPYRETTDRQS